MLLKARNKSFLAQPPVSQPLQRPGCSAPTYLHQTASRKLEPMLPLHGPKGSVVSRVTKLPTYRITPIEGCAILQ